jgi:hypothetical protein
MKRDVDLNSIKSIFLVIVLILASFTTLLTVKAATNITLPFTDNFANLNSWTIVNGIWTPMSGGVQGSSSELVLMVAGSSLWTDYQIITPVTISAGAEASIVFRYLTPNAGPGDSNNYYWAGIGCWGHQYSISKVVDGAYSEITFSGIASSNSAGTYTLEVVALGSTIKLFVNNNLVLTTTDTTHAFGSIGLRTYNATMLVKSISVSTATILSVSVSPGSASLDVGQSKTFTATASGGSGTYSSYHWYVNGFAQSGQTGSTFSFSPASAGSYSITATVTDSLGVTSAQSTPGSITVAVPPTVAIAPPGSFTMDVGQTKTFTATASGGSGTIHYQWLVGTTAVGADSSSYTYTASGTSASITCKVTDSASTPVTSSSNTVTISGTVLPPTVSVSPESATLDVGQSKTFIATANGGSGSYAGYHWYVNGAIQGDQTSSFSYSAASAGNYSITATVTDSSGATSTQSTASAVTVSDNLTLPSPSTPLYYVIIVILVLVGLFFGAVFTYKKRKKHSPAPVVPIKPVKPPTPPTPTPTQIRLSADPSSIVADGASMSVLTLQLVDKEGKPVDATADLLVKISASKGKLAQHTITISTGASTAKTFIAASSERGPVLVSATAEGLPIGEVELNFKEEEQHCLYCGAVTPSMYEPCPECGRKPL